MVGVFVSTWGCPWLDPSDRGKGYRWGEVEYVFGGRRLKARSTLPLIVEVLEPSRVVVVVLDTVAHGEHADYGGVVSQVEGMYKEFLGELGVDLSVELVVAPGIGDYPNGVFRGSMRDFYYYVLYRLAEALRGLDGDVDLYLDLSHGINFMPVLVYRAVRELAGLMALRRKVRLAVFNAEPYVRGVRQLRIHVVEDVEVSAEPVGYCFGGDKCRPLIPREGFPNDKRRELDGEVTSPLERMKGELNAFLGSIVNGLPLALSSFYPDTNFLSKYLSSIESVWRENISVKFEDRLLVERMLSFSASFGLLVKVYFTGCVLGLERSRIIGLSKILELKDRVFSYSNKLEIIISNDIADISKHIREKAEADGIPEGKWVRLREIIEGGGFDPRNFVAHSGLERNSVEVCVEQHGNNILLRYAEDFLGKVMEAARLGLIPIK